MPERTRLRPLRGIVCWIAAMIVCLAFPVGVVTAVAPILAQGVELLGNDHEHRVTTSKADWGVIRVERIASLLENRASTQVRFVTDAHLFHVIAPVITYLSLLAAWRPCSRREYRSRVVLACFIVPILFVLTGSTLLIGKLEMLVQLSLADLGMVRVEPTVIHWAIFTESGGGAMLSAGAALLNNAVAQWLSGEALPDSRGLGESTIC